MSETYLGNPRLKKSNVRIPFEQWQVAEYIKCAEDPEYFIRTYIKIVNIDRGLIAFEPYPFQLEIIDKVVDNRFVICKMPRQTGKTTTIAAMLLWYATFHENFNIAILANKMAQAREILSRIQLAYEHLPKWLQQGVVEWNKGNIELENGSKILASATSSSAIRGGSFNLIYLDEFAFVPSNLQEEFFASVYPTISSGSTSKVLITSTPNGLNMFYKIWTDSEEGNNSYVRVDVHWSDVPGRDEKWKEETIKNTSREQFRVEFECEFVGSSSTLISPEKLRAIPFKRPLKTINGLNIYSEPITDRLYTIVVDTSRGVGLDYSAFVVCDVTQMPYHVVACYRDNNILPIYYPNVIFNTAKHYNEAAVLIEVNDLGQQVADILYQDLEYEGVLATQNNGRAGQTIGSGFGSMSHIGVRTTKTVKRIGCSVLKTLVENDSLFINDYNILQELSRFSQNNGSYEAEDGHDDLVMCLVLFAWMVDQKYFKEYTSVDIRERLYKDNARLIEEEMLPFGIISDGREEHVQFQETITLESDSMDSWLSEKM